MLSSYKSWPATMTKLWGASCEDARRDKEYQNWREKREEGGKGRRENETEE